MSYTLLMGALLLGVAGGCHGDEAASQAINQKLGVETVADKAGYRVPEPEGERIDASG